MTQFSLKSSILNFAFSGVLAPRRHDYEAPRPVSEQGSKKK
jgi:hypothetical protein